MNESQKRKAPTDPTSGTDIRVTTSSGVDIKIARLSLEHQSATGPTTTQPAMPTPHKRQTQPPGMTEDLLKLMANTASKNAASNESSKSKKKNNKRAADNATASAPLPSATAGYSHYTSEVHEILDLIEAWETDPNNWIDPVALDTIKLHCHNANAEDISEFPKALARSVQSLQKQVDKHKEQLEGLKESADQFLGRKGIDDVTEQLERAIKFIGDTVDSCQQFVDGIKAVQKTLPPVETE
ncbi:hypothetical protein KC316_g6333 [Hortaea werneckii]|nr:hypothetical protein KC324_g6330 [Hortaea werneckii]KAI7585101.1 hypothetical protein KC316_g6333 [Hortaea werneckii]